MAFLLAVPLWSALCVPAAVVSAPVVIYASAAGTAAVATIGVAFGGLLRGAFEARGQRQNPISDPIIAPVPLELPDYQTRFSDVITSELFVYVTIAFSLAFLLLVTTIRIARTKASNVLMQKQGYAENMALNVRAATQALNAEQLLFAQKVWDKEVERRRLLSTIQKLKGKVQVLARIRPVLIHEKGDTPVPNASACASWLRVDPGGVGVEVLQSPDDKTLISCESTTDMKVTHTFEFDRVFDASAGQAQVFQEVVHLVQSAVDGYNVCIFAYGQTASSLQFGKTCFVFLPLSLLLRLFSFSFSRAPARRTR
jgi:hypothetical protein